MVFLLNSLLTETIFLRPFFLTGTVFCVRDSGSIEEACKCEKSVLAMFYYAEKETLLIIDEGLMLYQEHVFPDSKTQQMLKVCFCLLRYRIFSKICPGAARLLQPLERRGLKNEGY